MENELGALDVSRKTGKENFTTQDKTLEHNLLGFWQWAYSDIASNTLRGVLAEYIVACALGIATPTRIEWDAYDLQTSEGVKVEVKSAAYLQSWSQLKLSAISFDIAPTKSWDASTNQSSDETKRQADVYVFCLLHHKDKQTLNPLRLAQWTFYLLPTSILNANMPEQKRISLSVLLRLNPIETNFSEISETIQTILLQQ
jgi:hypothetical protein